MANGVRKRRTEVKDDNTVGASDPYSKGGVGRFQMEVLGRLDASDALPSSPPLSRPKLGVVCSGSLRRPLKS